MKAGGLLRLAAAGALLAGVLAFADPSAVLAALSGADTFWLLAGLAAALLSNVASALRWHALAAWMGGDIGRSFALLTYFRAMALNALLPGAVVGGDLFRALALRRAAMPSLDAGLSVLLDRVSGLWVLLAIAALALPAARGHLEVALPDVFALPDGLCVIAGTAVLLAPLVLGLLPLDVAGGRVVSALARVQARLLRAGALRQYGLQMLASCLVQILSVFALACGGLSLGLDLPFSVWLAAAAPVFLMAALPVSVGGWGTREAAAIAVLAAFGVAAPQAVGVAVIYGVFGLAQAALGGVLFARRAEPVAG